MSFSVQPALSQVRQRPCFFTHYLRPSFLSRKKRSKRKQTRGLFLPIFVFFLPPFSFFKEKGGAKEKKQKKANKRVISSNIRFLFASFFFFKRKRRSERKEAKESNQGGITNPCRDRRPRRSACLEFFSGRRRRRPLREKKRSEGKEPKESNQGDSFFRF